MIQVISALLKKDAKIHYKFISAFDGSTTSPSILEMVKEAELHFWMCDIKWSEHVFHFEVNKRGVCCLPREGGHRMKKTALCTAFVTDSLVEYKQFIARLLRHGMPKYVYLAEWRKFSVLFRRMTDCSLFFIWQTITKWAFNRKPVQSMILQWKIFTQYVLNLHEASI